jgi:hypothetical protein
MSIFTYLPPAFGAGKIASELWKEHGDEIKDAFKKGAEAFVDAGKSVFNKAESYGKSLIDRGALLARSVRRFRLLTYDKNIPCH